MAGQSDMRIECRDCPPALRAAAGIHQVPLDSIDASPQPWHIRRGSDSGQLHMLLDAIRATGHVEPLRLAPNGTGSFIIVSGWLRYQAALFRRAEGGADTIPAVLVPAEDTANLLRFAILEGEARYPWSVLELGWALQRLRAILEEGREDKVRQSDLLTFLQLPPARWKSRISEALGAAEALPEPEAGDIALRHGCDIGALSSQRRAVYRQLKNAPLEQQHVLREVLGEAIAGGKPVGPRMRAARRALEDPKLARLASEAVLAGRAVSSVLPSALPGATVRNPTQRSTLRRLLATFMSFWLRVLHRLREHIAGRSPFPSLRARLYARRTLRHGEVRVPRGLARDSTAQHRVE